MMFNRKKFWLILLVVGFLWTATVVVKQYNIAIKSKSSTVALNEDSRSNVVVLYNRVPKTGSTSFMSVLYKLHFSNKFGIAFVNVSSSRHIFTFVDQYKFAENITYWHSFKPAFFHGHFPYINFRNLGLQSPIYINIIRKPLERLVSHYYFVRYGDNFLPNKKRKHQGDTTTFDECVQHKGFSCSPQSLWLQIPYFCGTDEECWNPGSKQALKKAKSNVINNYFLVGTTEHMTEFIDLLENTLPQFFKGATSLFTTDGEVHIRKTSVKKPVKPETVAYFKQNPIWQMENEFYLFVKARFEKLYKQSLISKTHYQVSYVKLKTKNAIK